MGKPKTTPAHEYAEIFALHEGPPLWELSDRIKANGQREEIVTLDGKILDGRRRELACFRAGVTPKYRKFGSRKSDGTDPLEFVIDTNLHRRHLGEGERKLAAAKYAEAKVGRPAEKSSQLATIYETENLDQITQSSSSNQKNDTPTAAAAAERFEVSEADVDRAKAVIKGGSEALVQAVAEDLVTVSDAQKVAKKPREIQDAAVEAVKAGEAKSLVAAVKKIEREPGDDTPPEITDLVGHAVPEAAVAAFANVEKFKELDGLIRQLQKGIDELSRLPGGEKLRGFLQPTGSEGKTINKSEHLNALKRELTGTRPHSVCPYCAGKATTGCKGCQGLGWVTATTWKDAADEVKAKLSVA